MKKIMAEEGVSRRTAFSRKREAPASSTAGTLALARLEKLQQETLRLKLENAAAERQAALESGAMLGVDDAMLIISRALDAVRQGLLTMPDRHSSRVNPESPHTGLLGLEYVRHEIGQLVRDAMKGISQ